MKNTFILSVFFFFSLHAIASQKDLCVLQKGDELFVSVKETDDRDLLIHFKHCMYNNLMTFYKVGSASTYDSRCKYQFDG